MQGPAKLRASLADLLATRAECRAGDWPPAAVAFTALALAEVANAPVVWITDGPATLALAHRDLLALGGDAGRALAYPAWAAPAAPDAEAAGQRLRVLRALADGAARGAVIITCVQALMQRTAAPELLAASRRRLAVGGRQDRDALLRFLAQAGYAIEPEVQGRGEAAAKGGIVDVWPVGDEWPSRIELFGPQIESIRTFNPADQRSVERRDAVEITAAAEWTAGREAAAPTATLADHLGGGACLIWHDADGLREHAAVFHETAVEAGAQAWVSDYDAVGAALGRAARLALFVADPLAGAPPEALRFEPLRSVFAMPRDTLEPDVAERERQRFVQDLAARAAAGAQVRLHFDTEGALQRFREGMGRELRGVELRCAALSGGFVNDALGLAVAAEADLYGRRKEGRDRAAWRPPARRPEATGPRIDDLASLEPGGLVVHADHGIGRYQGIRTIRMQDEEREVLAIEYDEGAMLYTPVAQVHLLSRYVGSGRRHVQLHRLGGARWLREKQEAERAVEDLAAALLETQAARQALPGYAFGPDTAWQHEFDAAFPYVETPDQERAIGDVKADMEQARPMDRLICGDAGYGKTEVAMRAAFKAVMAQKQVAVLVPTTVLAQQHHDTFRQRMGAYPVRIEMLSRFNSQARHEAILGGLQDGTVDIVIGTHALLQPGVRFRDLGLAIIDEEQRFGVAHKEKLKHLRRLVDVLTLTATPIPRTLYMSLTGAKDLSTIETPPQERRMVETEVREYDERLIRQAILRELNREGQVFFIHNRVMTIDTVRQRLGILVPEARIAVAHGQMASAELAAVMHRFAGGAVDVLLCTTIVESGLDVPRANTILIDRADRFGLADLYQLRGRVGRSDRKAYAVLLIPGRAGIDADARRRIHAVQSHAAPGSGFRLALRDLEIRGAGNLLGAAQSGHIAAIGFALYCQLLQRTVQRMKGEAAPGLVDVELQLDFIRWTPDPGDAEAAAAIPHSYIEDERTRLDAYWRIAALATARQVDALRDELRDRFGTPPPAVEALLQIARIRVAAARRGIRRIECRGDKLMLSTDQGFLQPGGNFPRLKADGAEGKLKEILRAVNRRG